MKFIIFLTAVGTIGMFVCAFMMLEKLPEPETNRFSFVVRGHQPSDPIVQDLVWKEINKNKKGKK